MTPISFVPGVGPGLIAVPAPAPVPIRIAAAATAPVTDPTTGDVWAIDQNFAGGLTWPSNAVTTGTTCPALYDHCRYGAFSYTIPIPSAGDYSVRLCFSEMSRQNIGARIFNVTINGIASLVNFDIVQEAGGPLIAVEKIFLITAVSQIQIDFTVGSIDLPLICGIEIIPIPPPFVMQADLGVMLHQVAAPTAWPPAGWAQCPTQMAIDGQYCYFVRTLPDGSFKALRILADFEP